MVQIQLYVDFLCQKYGSDKDTTIKQMIAL